MIANLGAAMAVLMIAAIVAGLLGFTPSACRSRVKSACHRSAAAKPDGLPRHEMLA